MAAPKHLSDLEVFKECKAEIAYEAQLVSQRLGWYVASQSFLLTALAFSSGTNENGIIDLGSGQLFPWVPMIGIILSVTVYYFIDLAFSRAAYFRERIEHLSNKNSEIDALFYRGAKAAAPWGKWFSQITPFLFAAIWLIILMRGLVWFFYATPPV